MNGKAFTCLLGLLLLLTQPGVALDSFVNPANGVGPVPLGLGIDPFYEKYLDADGIAIVSSGKVADEALVMARRMVTTMLSKRSDVRTVMVEKGCKLMIIGQHEQVCDLPSISTFAIHRKRQPTGTSVHVVLAVILKDPTAQVVAKRTCCAWRAIGTWERASWCMNLPI